MKNKKIFMLLIVLIIIGLLCISSLLILNIFSLNLNNDSLNNNNDKNEIKPTPTNNLAEKENKYEDNKNNIVKEDSLINFELIVLDSLNTLSLFKLNGERLVLYLDAPKISDIKWNKNKDKFGFLIEENGVRNLLFYSVQNKKITKATQYTKQQGGISSYLWKDNTKILFTQGDNPIWLHTYDTDAESIIKEKVIDGYLYTTNLNSSYIIFKNTKNEFLIYNDKFEEIRQIKVPNIYSNTKVNNLFYITNNLFILNTEEDNSFILDNNQNTLLEKINNNLNFYQTCTNTQSEYFYAYDSNNKLMKVNVVNTQKNDWEILVNKLIDTVEVSDQEVKIKCSKDILVIQSTDILKIYKNNVYVDTQFLDPKNIQEIFI